MFIVIVKHIIKAGRPSCRKYKLRQNGRKTPDKCGIRKKNYKFKVCGRQFILERQQTYRGALSWIDEIIERMMRKRCGIRRTAHIQKVSQQKTLRVLMRRRCLPPPSTSDYRELQVEEIYHYVGSKEKKVRAIYAYAPEGEIVAYALGGRSAEKAERLRDKQIELGVKWGRIASDDWRAFKQVFQDDNHVIGKKYTKHIEGNNTRIRHLSSRFGRRDCCKSKKIENHEAALILTVMEVNSTGN